MKVDLEEVQSVLLQKHFDPIKVNEVIKELTEVVEELKADKDAAAIPKTKWEHVIVLHDKDNVLAGREIAGWVVQQESDADPVLVLGKLTDAARAQNEAARRRRNIITDLPNLFEFLKPKWLKEKKLRIKTKELTRVLITNGRL